MPGFNPPAHVLSSLSRRPFEYETWGIIILCMFLTGLIERYIEGYFRHRIQAGLSIISPMNGAPMSTLITPNVLAKQAIADHAAM